ncbi:hypothetical protein ABAC460_15000 [Asticcacaulis sp. AC460]|uniref:cell wall hydrolase n=1 Tax=Asticcacaulis sp. AC460 TaxID=1282360 RepID=UPI0003C3EA19|nr:cell wall hydrolase [Asticcacaulis sp. AC460]ESQ88597.1 hypothetical protein ABAC460_15000 [Asticcacaulis sp. AC460]
MAASSIGLLIGASIGSAYLGGALVHDSTARHTAARILQLASISKDGKIDETELHRLEAASDAAPVSRTAMNIAMRFTDYAGTDAPNSLLAQNLTALRTSSDQRYQGAEVVRASVEIPAAPQVAAVVTRAAAAFGFKGSTQNDLDCLTQGVYYEARGEGVDGMRAVAQVILNRVRHPAYPKTVCNVVYQGAHLRTSCQFSFTCNGALGRPVEKWAWRRAHDVAQAALGGYVMPVVGTATSFHTTGVNPRWSGTMERVTQVGTHVFYQFRGRGSRMGGDGVVQPSNSVPQIVQAGATDPTLPSDALNQAQTVAQPADALAPNVSMAPTTKSPTGEARAALIAAVAKASPEAPRAISVKSTISGKSAQDITAEVAMKSGGVSQ